LQPLYLLYIYAFLIPNWGNIEFIGIEYTKALEEKEALNKNTAQLQFEVLEKEKKWISDTEADKLLTHDAKFR